jgi:hypothetical protein
LSDDDSLSRARRVSSGAAVCARIIAASHAAITRTARSSAAVATAQLCNPSLRIVWLLMADLGQANDINKMLQIERGAVILQL